jgi:hypothetical protein
MNANLFKAIAIGAALALAGCHLSGSSTPAATYADVSGDYFCNANSPAGCVETWSDAASGSASAVSATFAQHGNAAGGTMTGTFAGTTLTAQLSLLVTSSNALSGAMVVDYPPAGTGAVCTFSTTGTYTNTGSGNATIAGTYSAVTGCTGDSGSYTLSQNCTDTVASKTGPRRDAFPPAC